MGTTKSRRTIAQTSRYGSCLLENPDRAVFINHASSREYQLDGFPTNSWNNLQDVVKIF